MGSDIFEPMTSPLAFGILSGVLSTLAFVPYIINTVCRRTRPLRETWLIWSVLGSIAFFSQVHEGAAESLWFAGVRVSGAILVLLLALRFGATRRLKMPDYLILAAAAAGLVLWYNTDSAAYALAITISVSLLGGSMTVHKAYRHPGSETLTTWLVTVVSSFCAILSVGRFDAILIAYPAYLFTMSGAIALAMLLGRTRRAERARMEQVV